MTSDINNVDAIRFATRLNSFMPLLLSSDSDEKTARALRLIARAGRVRRLSAVDLNFPDHVDSVKTPQIRDALTDAGLSLNGFAMRYYGNSAFRRGAFTNPDPGVRRAAIDLTKRGIDTLADLGGGIMTLWLGQDGFDYPLSAGYAAMWDMEIEGIREVADHNKDISISLEYKPNEPRAFSLLPDAATTLLAIREIDCANLGVTLDLAHSLYADEQPAFTAALIARHSRLLGLHLNDSYAKRDDGLMPGSVHLWQTLELLAEIADQNYDGVIYFDTFPDIAGIDPIRECEANIATVRRLSKVAARLNGSNEFRTARAAQDPIACQRILQCLMFGDSEDMIADDS
jgi:xylose isomerase